MSCNQIILLSMLPTMKQWHFVRGLTVLYRTLRFGYRQTVSGRLWRIMIKHFNVIIFLGVLIYQIKNEQFLIIIMLPNRVLL